MLSEAFPWLVRHTESAHERGKEPVVPTGIMVQIPPLDLQQVQLNGMERSLGLRVIASNLRRIALFAGSSIFHRKKAHLFNSSSLPMNKLLKAVYPFRTANESYDLALRHFGPDP